MRLAKGFELLGSLYSELMGLVSSGKPVVQLPLRITISKIPQNGSEPEERQTLTFSNPSDMALPLLQLCHTGDRITALRFCNLRTFIYLQKRSRILWVLAYIYISPGGNHEERSEATKVTSKKNAMQKENARESDAGTTEIYQYPSFRQRGRHREKVEGDLEANCQTRGMVQNGQKIGHRARNTSRDACIPTI